MTHSYEITYDLTGVDTSDFPMFGDTLQDVLQANNEAQAMKLARIRNPWPVLSIRDISEEWLSAMSAPLAFTC